MHDTLTDVIVGGGVLPPPLPELPPHPSKMRQESMQIGNNIICAGFRRERIIKASRDTVPGEVRAGSASLF